MKRIVLFLCIVSILTGCSFVVPTTERFKDRLDRQNGRNIKDLIRTTESSPPYKVENKGAYVWYYTKGNMSYKGIIQPTCYTILITNFNGVVIDNIIQTPQTCKLGYGGV